MAEAVIITTKDHQGQIVDVVHTKGQLNAWLWVIKHEDHLRANCAEIDMVKTDSHSIDWSTVWEPDHD